jgi:uncharacterized protein YycO
MKKKIFKTFVTLTTVLTLVLNLNVSAALANDVNTANEQITQLLHNPALKNATTDLLTAYENIVIYAENNYYYFDTCLEQFVEDYNVSNFNSINEYYNEQISKLVSLSSTSAELSSIISVQSSGDDEWSWQYDTGTTLPQKANYSRLNLLSSVMSGDIIFELAGGYYITNHAAIVEGIYYSATYAQYYIRIIEAIEPGVCRSVLDDDRFIGKTDGVYRVNGTSSQKSGAVIFAVGQLGDSYFFDGPLYDFTPGESSWYCSELVWAAYFNQGINIWSKWPSVNYIAPADISINGVNVTSVSVN